MKSSTRLRISFAGLLLIVLAVGAVGVATLRRTTGRLSAALEEAFDAGASTDALLRLVHEERLLVSVAAAAGRAPAKERLDRLRADAERRLDELARHAAGDAARLRDLLAEARAHSAALLAQARGRAPDGGAAGEEEAGIAARYGELEGRVELQQAEERSRILLLAAQSRREVRRLSLISGALVGVALAAVALLFGAIRARLLRPLAALAATARQVATQQDLTVAIPSSGDQEIRDLSGALREMMAELRTITEEIRGATDRLLDSADSLGRLTRAHGEAIGQQASALEEARRSSGLLSASARASADRAAGVLRVAERAEALGRTGEAAVAASLAGVETIQGHTRQMVDRIALLATSAQQIGAITATVKELADQSNLLALNAAIEAARAGPAGDGFAVVAREIRSLADRSIRSTLEVRRVLADVLAGIQGALDLVQAADAGIGDGASRTRSLGASVEELVGIVRQNLQAVREIAGEVTGQVGGIAQISVAFDRLAAMMDETVQSMRTTGEGAEVIREVSERVSAAVKVFRL